MTGIDHCKINQSELYEHLKSLGNFFPTILKTTEQSDAYLREISSIQLEENLPPNTNNGNVVQLDIWWAAVFKTGPHINSSFGAMGDIYGPHVESSFSAMCDIIDKKANRLDVMTWCHYGSKIWFKIERNCFGSISLERSLVWPG